MAIAMIKLGELGLSAPAFNAVGPWSATRQDLLDLNDSDSSAVLTKSFMLKPWAGNPEPNIYTSEHYAVNSVGLKSEGADYFLKAVEDLKGKPLIASLVAFEAAEYVELVKKVNTSNFDAIELNLSCPNIETKEPIGFSPERTADLLSQVMKVAEKPIGVKLPPYLSRPLFRKTCEAVLLSGANHVVLINTYPLAASVDEAGKPHIVPNDGIGGMSGAALKPIALAHVLLCRQFTDGKLPIVGVGGIETKKDVQEFLTAGASAVQVGTALFKHGLAIFTDLNS